MFVLIIFWDRFWPATLLPSSIAWSWQVFAIVERLLRRVGAIFRAKWQNLVFIWRQKIGYKNTIIIIAQTYKGGVSYCLWLKLYVSNFLGYIYEAYDSQLRMNVALKMEKKDKSKNILKFEYQVLQHLKGK